MAVRVVYVELCNLLYFLVGKSQLLKDLSCYLDNVCVRTGDLC
jgi:hypothetical protein